MKLPRVRLDLNGTDALQGGEPWEGVVHVDVDASVAFDAVVLWVGWRTHGRADPEEHEVCREVLRARRGGGAYGFSVRMPHGPYTYHGHYTNLDWYAVASLELDGVEVMRETNEIVLHPAKDAPMRGALTRSAQSMAIDPAAEYEEELEDAWLGVAVVWGMYALGVLGVLAWWVVTGEALFVWLPVGVGVAAYLCVDEFKVLWQHRRMGDVRLEVGRSVRVGGALDVSWSMTPNARVKVRSVRARLKAMEHASSDQGTYTRTDVEEMACIEHELMGEGAFEPFEPSHLEASLRVPEGIPVSLEGRDSAVRWVLEFEADVVAGLDWTCTRDVHVGPKKR